MSVDVPDAVLAGSGGSRKGAANVSFNRVLLYMLVGIGVLLLVIEVVALGNGLALARSITTSVDELFSGTERVKKRRFRQPHRGALGRPARASWRRRSTT